jgi:hypothetical protein
MPLKPETLAKIICPRPPPTLCYNKGKFKLIHEYPPDKDSDIYYHIECLDCGYNFSITQKDVKWNPQS